MHSSLWYGSPQTIHLKGACLFLYDFRKKHNNKNYQINLFLKTVFRRQLLNYPADESSAGVYVSLALGKIFFIL